MSQNDRRKGRFPAVAAEDLSDNDDYIGELTHSGGELRVQLPTGNTSRALVLIVNGATSGNDCLCEPLEPAQQIRVKAKGTGNPGDSICLADVGTSEDKGKIRALPASADTYRVFAICEEEFADGGLALIRPNGSDSVTVTE